MRVVLDSGAFIAVARDDRRVMALIKLARRSSAVLVSTPSAVGQVWRNGARQALLARAIPTVEVQPMTLDDGKDAGELLLLSDTSDVVHAGVALLALPGDQILTSDVADLTHLVRTRRMAVTVTGV